jgi:hypothetical protein
MGGETKVSEWRYGFHVSLRAHGREGSLRIVIVHIGAIEVRVMGACGKLVGPNNIICMKGLIMMTEI